MKKIYLSIAVIAAFLTTYTNFGQTNHIPNIGATETFNVVTGDHFFDPGGPSANYPNCGCDTFTTLTGATQIEFLDFEVFAYWDYLKLYDGTDNTGTLLYDNGTTGSPNYDDETLADMVASHGSAVFTGTSGSFFFEFHASGTVDRRGWDVVVQAGATLTCPAPTSLTASNVLTTSADLDWTEAGTATTWDVHVVPAGDPAPTSTTTPSDAGITAKPLNKTGLTDGTDYEFYVRADCGGGDLSNWEGPVGFKTQCAASTLAITSTTPATVNCGGFATLAATSSGTGNDIFWYDAATGGTKVGDGSTFQTPVLYNTTSYWATEVTTTGSTGNVGPLDPAANGGAGGGTSSATYAMIFDVHQPTTLLSVDVFPNSSVGTSASIEIFDPSGALIIDVPYTTTVTGGSTPQTVPLNVSLAPGIGYEIEQGSSTSLFRNTSGATYPYSSAFIDITGCSFTNQTYYYYFYNWQFSSVAIQCESTPRTEVVATVVTNGDKQVPSGTTPAVYTDTDNTGNFSDAYSGAPGTGCGTTDDYLGGNEVVYYYTAGDSYGLNIAMSGLSAGESGVFIYEDCADIGTDCFDGMSSTTTTDYNFNVLVQSGEDYYIVVSSSAATGTLGYTLTLTETASPCQSLAITNSVPATINCGGIATLTVTDSGTGDAIYWYDAATGGNKIGEGPSYTTPVLDTTTSYWATEVITTGSTLPGQGKTAPTGTSSFGSTLNYGLEFDVAQPFTLISVDVYPDDVAGVVEVSLFDNGGGLLQTASINVPASTGNTAYTVPLNFQIPVGTGYRLLQTSNPSLDLIRDSSGNSYPYPLGPNGDYGDITNGTYGTSTTNSSSYYYFYNWSVSSIAVACESAPRTEVIATVINGDKQVPSTTTPSVYTDTDDTGNFGDSYSGAPGSNCGTTSNYLGGNEVVYYYTAGDSYSLNIAMSGLSAGESGVFVYDSCLDIGTNCIEGMTSATTADYDFDIVVQSGEDYYIVVSSSAATGTLGYTLTLTETASPCLNLDISATTGATIPCIGSGTLSATASGIGHDIYWYDAATGGNLVGIGSTFTTPEISTTTSYWAAEVITDNAGGGGSLPTYCTPTFSTGCTVGDDIDDFVLTDSLGNIVIEHLGSGCSASAYDDLTGDASLTGVLVPGETYTFDITHNTANQEINIWVDLNANGSFTDPGEELFVTSGSGSGNSSTGTITIPAGAGGATVMRVMASWSGPATDPCNTGETWGEAHDYKLILPSLVCESPRVQATATVSTAGDITVTTPLPYTNTNDTGNYGNPYEGTPGGATLCGTTENYLNGNDVVYHFTAQTTELVNIKMSGLSAYYASVFVYDSCAELGTDCLAGAVNGPSDDDFAITDFPVQAGEDYYIVVSSWLTPSYSYQLDIIPFDCANLESPDGDANQSFVTNDTVSTLDVDPTRPGATLTYYAEPGDIPGNPITGDPALINGEDYFVTQTYNGCEGAPLQIDVTEIDCSMLAITSTSPGSVTCRGKVTLGAVGSGQGDDLYWYDVATGGTPIGFGPQFETDELSTTTSYWVSEVYASGVTLSGFGEPVPNPSNIGRNYSNYGMVFDVSVPFTLISVDVYPDDSGGPIDFELLDSSGAVLNTASFNLPAGTGTTAVTIPLNFFIPAGQDYRLLKTTSNYLIRDNLNLANFPYSLGSYGSITASATSATGSTTSYYYFLYNWSISTGSMICESPRTQVDATVNQTGDVTVDHTDLSYTTTDNTGNYGNNFSGDAGTGCDGTDILGGNEVIYRYTADPNNDDILDIELSGISHPSTGMYIYASCGDVGIDCLEGGTNENSSNILIDDYYVPAGTEIFIVISSESSSTNYTLTINGIDCSNVAPPSVNNAPISFIGGDALDDLELDFNQYGTLTWYASPADIPGNPLPGSTPVVDGTTYYVTQTILGCESAPLAVTPEEFQCADMKITSISPDMLLCAPGGDVSLTAQATGLGSEIYWYDAATGGNIINAGEIFETNVSSTTSFWAGEVFIEGMAPGSVGPLSPAALGGSGGGTATTIYYTTFDVLQQTTLLSVDVFPINSGDNASIIVREPSGNQIIEVPYTTNVSGGSTAQTVMLNVSLPPGTYEMVQGTTTSLFRNTSGATFPYTSPFINILSHSFSNQTYYYYFFNWQYGGGMVLCESARTEVTVTINDQPTDAPTGLSAQKVCEGATLADIPVTGTDIKWYAQVTGGSELGLATVLSDGDVYYASQTVDACESDSRLEVTVYVDPLADTPTGDINQDFVDGETLADLDVTGDNLVWYDDKGNEIADPANHQLENYETYCVRQAPQGYCEGEELCITVHEILGVGDPLFENLVYHPNPAKHRLDISNSSPIEKVALYDMLGRKVMEQKVNAPTAGLDVSALQSGTYLLWVTIDGKTGTFKLIKE